MLVLALGATLVGFVLLVAALISGVLWLAVACIVVCVIGVGFLLADLIGLGRRSNSDEADHDARPESGADDQASPGSADKVRDQSGHQQDSDAQGHSDVPGHSDVQGHRYDDDPPTEEIHLDKPR
ncbi:hypothetical protein [Williamsia muralis]|uniref:DUF308 domain-containing protein n=1 Tax=Williamsia marianensis TaxID=85044 RepID=A0A2G3PK10_WILMA|nr:hypothetical protein [Williamsia marianensis]PHV66063.1 hypothetical protein CSW57_20725 [Williamsia marianensis]